MDEKFVEIINEMAEVLNAAQLMVELVTANLNY